MDFYSISCCNVSAVQTVWRAFIDDIGDCEQFLVENVVLGFTGLNQISVLYFASENCIESTSIYF